MSICNNNNSGIIGQRLDEDEASIYTYLKTRNLWRNWRPRRRVTSSFESVCAQKQKANDALNEVELANLPSSFFHVN